MVTIEELKLGNRTLEALKFLLEQITELETAVGQIDISEIKDANALTKEQIATLQDIKNVVEAINSDLNLKKADFDSNMSAFRNDKADFDEKKADFDSKNNTALSNFDFIASNVEKINSTSSLLAEAQAILETIEPMEQRAQVTLNTIANSQAKFDELDALKTSLLELKRSLENINIVGLISDNTIGETTTYSSKKVEDLVSNTKTTLTADIKSKTDSLTTIVNNQKQSIITLDNKINTTQGNLNNFASSVSGALEQKANKTTFDTFATNVTNDLNNKANKNDVPSVTTLEATFIKKTDKIDAYNKRESDERYTQKSDVTDGVKIGSYLLWSSQSVTPAGFLTCDGRSLKKSEYAELFAVIGYTYGGSGDDFNIPNFSDGKFMRSIGGNAAALGTAQQDAIRNIQGELRIGDGTGICTTSSSASGAFTKGNTRYSALPLTGGSESYSMLFSASRVVPTANENRPYNTAVVVLIKAKEVKEPSANQIDKSIYATETKAGIAKLKNSITAKQEDAAVTEKAVSNAIEAMKSIGVDQTWQDVWAQRELNTYYPNVSKRPIYVCISFEAAAIDIAVSAVVDDIIVETADLDNYTHTGFSFIVPAGSKYKLATLSNTNYKKTQILQEIENRKLNSWTELK